ncbi:hypothetical protein KMZ32_07125 [Phycicoccus sp. MAQZ13P-2]|uniref:hypothetical protein n=1 Tax=Phycicoccus mangrovi TaxID=2840470 RepID=UPI001C008CF3|nr:hypothetical protein [Phycicoccus mangrovi]MBT9256145.1 hypothetical protein [Phycicoccus mangrovi]MBT9273840.1 hypothetical protein [Phycicoccus mangrovi]
MGSFLRSRLGPGSVVVATLALFFVVGLGLTLVGVVLAVTLGPWPLAAGVLVTSVALAGAGMLVRRGRVASHEPAGP